MAHMPRPYNPYVHKAWTADWLSRGGWVVAYMERKLPLSQHVIRVRVNIFNDWSFIHSLSFVLCSNLDYPTLIRKRQDTCEWLQKLTAFEQGVIIIVSHFLWHGISKSVLLINGLNKVIIVAVHQPIVFTKECMYYVSSEVQGCVEDHSG